MMCWMMKIMGLPSCEELETFTQDYIANELEPSLKEKFDNHLLKCKNCANFIESYKKTTQLGKYFEPPPIDTEFKNMLKEYLQGKKK